MITYRDLLRGDPLDVIAPAAKADRTPDWNKWRLMPTAPLWQCVALSMNIDPAQVDTDDVSWRGVRTVFNKESQEFRDRMDVACAHAEEGALRFADYGDGPDSYRVSLHEFAAWVQKIGWEAPAELLAMADEQVASKADRAHSGKRTGAATATREARKADRSRDLKRFIEDVYEALENAGHDVGENGSRKPLPVSVGDLYTLFLVRHPDHKVAQSTFDDHLGKIATVQPGRKRYTVADLANLLAGTFSG